MTRASNEPQAAVPSDVSSAEVIGMAAHTGSQWKFQLLPWRRGGRSPEVYLDSVRSFTAVGILFSMAACSSHWTVIGAPDQRGQQFEATVFALVGLVALGVAMFRLGRAGCIGLSIFMLGDVYILGAAGSTALL